MPSSLEGVFPLYSSSDLIPRVLNVNGSACFVDLIRNGSLLREAVRGREGGKVPFPFTENQRTGSSRHRFVSFFLVNPSRCIVFGINYYPFSFFFSVCSLSPSAAFVKREGERENKERERLLYIQTWEGLCIVIVCGVVRWRGGRERVRVLRYES